jgi:nucleotide-binding universal stress UspA family protein
MRIIVLVDFSLYTQSLIRVATHWAELLNAELILVHEVPRLAPAMVDDNTRYKIIDLEKEEALSKLKKLTERTIPDHLSVDYEVTERRLTYFLPQLMPQKIPTLIMLGLKGTGLLKRVFLGSVATKIISELNKTTVGVPIKITQAVPENLILPVNPEYSINHEKLNQLLIFLRPSLKNIDFIALNPSIDTETESTNLLKELTNKYNGSLSTNYKIFKSKKAFDEFKSYTTQKGNSFLVLQKGSRSFNDMIYRQFFINRIVHDGSIPLIVLPK